MELRDLPSVDAVVAAASDGCDLPATIVAGIARNAVDAARQAIIDGHDGEDPVDRTLREVAAVARARPHRVINATGVLLHTNLGRAPLPSRSADLAAGVAAGYSNVEVNLDTGQRASRHDYLSPLVATVTHADDGFAVNNNAGALMLALASVAGAGGRVAVSRGELIEIGGSFRLPDLMRASGVELVEVGTTNRTRLADYEAVVDSVDAVLKVHPSNYRIDGFREEATWSELARLSGEHEVPFIADVGSGLIDEAAPWLQNTGRAWLADEPGVQQVVELGADLVLFSGDKLLGGPQAGIIAGTHDAVNRARSHPIARAVRLDGGTIAALSHVLESYARADVLSIPFWRMASSTLDELNARAEKVAAAIDGVRIVDSEAVPGAGSVPGATIPSVAIRLSGSADATWQRLASWQTPIIGIRQDGATLLDMRTIDPSDDDIVTSAIPHALG